MLRLSLSLCDSVQSSQLILSVFVYLYLVSCASNYLPARESLLDVSWASPLVLSLFVYVSLYPNIPNSLSTTVFKALPLFV